MKKIIIRQVNDRFVAFVDAPEPKFNQDGCKDVFAVFDVSEVFIHC